MNVLEKAQGKAGVIAQSAQDYQVKAAQESDAIRRESLIRKGALATGLAVLAYVVFRWAA